ncbi:hypothetical protein GCM10009847_26770 [Leucobacter tardus]|uniref:Uncharacterized protein n=1 Tax=Leucobacter tardus TaxID=501483 RepID=A0A939TN43_9MICO|nr:hypothetical protein [Leucobacter tardus]MBO2989819.1 hypothetical protein [Leucobacter tardus]
METFLSDIGPYLVSGGIFGAIATVAVAIITSRSKRGTERADAAATITESATDLLTPMREELARLREDQRQQAEDHRAELQILTRRVAKLEGMVEEYARREWALVRYVRALIDSHRRHAPGAELPPVPQALTDLI